MVIDRGTKVFRIGVSPKPGIPHQGKKKVALLSHRIVVGAKFRQEVKEVRGSVCYATSRIGIQLFG